MWGGGEEVILEARGGVFSSSMKRGIKGGAGEVIC